jgi:mRNA-degrading endonuclease toxin of MazEF toxin-antitoxin module
MSALVRSMLPSSTCRRIVAVRAWANCTQVFTLDRNRLRTRLGFLPAEVLEAIDLALADTLGRYGA